MSETAYIHRLTVAVPQALMEAANHFAVAIGEMAGDFESFVQTGYEDAQGRKYAVISTACTNLLFSYAGGELQQRPFAPPGWDRAKAQQAQAAVDLWFGPTEQQPEPPLARPGKIVGVVHQDNFYAIAAMGLTKLPEEEPI
jgi:hypothetical protein